MAGRSRARTERRAAGNARIRRTPSTGSSEFSRSRLLVGIIVVAAIGGGVAFGLSRMRGGPHPGRLVYATAQGVYSHDLATGADRRLVALPEGTAAAIPSPDGKWVAYSKGAGEVWIAPLDGGGEPYQVGEQFVLPLGWSRDSRLLVNELASDKDLVLVDPEGSREIIGSGVFPGISVPVWLDDRRFAVASTPSEFVVVDIETKRSSASFPGTPLAASPDGAELLIARDGGVLVMKVESDEPVGIRVIFEGQPLAAAASPQGFLGIAAKDKDGHNGVWIFEGGDRSRQVVEGKVNSLAWAAQGGALIYERKGELFALERPGAEPKRVSRPGVEVFPIASFTVVPG